MIAGAAFEGLKRAFSEMFRRNEFVHRADVEKIRDLIVEITGLNRQDGIVNAILGTFMAIKDFVDVARTDDVDNKIISAESVPAIERSTVELSKAGVSLVYNINIVLPETTNIQVFNSIFRSLKDNMLSDH